MDPFWGRVEFGGRIQGMKYCESRSTFHTIDIDALLYQASLPIHALELI
jgi:hypothetical protein